MENMVIVMKEITLIVGEIFKGVSQVVELL